MATPASSVILQAVQDNDVSSLENALRSLPRDRYSAATFTLPLPPSVKQIVLPVEHVSLMHISAYFDTLDCFLYLESKNLLYNQESADSYLPIHYACLNKSYEVVCYILNKDPKQAAVLPPVTHHLLYLATLAGDAEILSLLFENGADLSLQKNLENKPIALAIRSRHVDCLRLLLQHNLRKSKIDTREYSTLMLAIANNEKDAVPMLLESGEDPAFVTSAQHESALFLACFFGKEWLNVIKMIC
jgi:ankyrin repeat protein